MQILDRNSLRGLSKVRLVGSNENEIVSPLVALERAEQRGMDLVLVSMDVEPPVVRIQDFRKVQYEKKKAKKPVKKSALKEVQFKANISDHDLETKVKSIEKFLARGDKVKITVRLKGRERETPERARQLIDKVIAATEGCKASSLGGPFIGAILEPAKA